MKKIIFCIISLLTLGMSSAKAQEFFDTSMASQFFTFGARVGFNTSNRTFPQGNYFNEINTTWGTGFNAGVVANLNFREYLSIQPGIFFESRSNNLFNAAYENEKGNPYIFLYEKDHMRSFYFTIPVMGIVNFNLADRIKWSVEFGPYFQFSLKQTGSQNDVHLLTYMPDPENPNQINLISYTGKHRSCDVGLKMGTGLQLYEHYYVGVHYLAGLCNAWKLPEGGRNKGWMFTVGYDF